jgi:hypothetical protein
LQLNYEGVNWVEVGTEHKATDDVETWELLGWENGFQVRVYTCIYLFHYFFVYLQVNILFQKKVSKLPVKTI